MNLLLLLVIGFGAWLHFEPDFWRWKLAIRNRAVNRRVGAAYRKRMKARKGS